MQKIIPCLWFDTQAEEAADFYTGIFRHSNVNGITHYGKEGFEQHGMPEGTVLEVEFTLNGYNLSAINGGPRFTFNPSISFMVNCTDTTEVDRLWQSLSQGGKSLMPIGSYPFSERYGWCEDKYGVSWQIIYTADPSAYLMPSLMFVGKKAGKAEEAIGFYANVFRNAKVNSITRYEADQEPDKEGTVMYADFSLENQHFIAMDSAQTHDFDFNEAFSFTVLCENQAEIDYYWEQLSAVPESEMCGWLKDTYGVSWQIVPEGMSRMLNDSDKQKAGRAFNAMLQMKKINIAEIERAYKG